MSESTPGAHLAESSVEIPRRLADQVQAWPTEEPWWVFVCGYFRELDQRVEALEKVRGR